jgi:DNA invertase Pin-like site-specific DNA recombinase
MTEFERPMNQEHVKASLRNAQAKGKRLGRPRRVLDATRIAALRASGTSWWAISHELGFGLATLYRGDHRIMWG